MKKIEPEHIISILTPKEFKRFGDYVYSPFFNVPERIRALYDFIRKNYTAITKGQLSREQIAAKVLKGSNTPSNIRRLFSDFNKETENFLQFIEFENDTNYRTIALLKNLRSKKDSSPQSAEMLEQKFRELEKKLASSPGDSDTFRLAMGFYKQKSLAESPLQFSGYSESLQKESDTLDAFYINRKLLLFQLMYSKQQMNKQPLDYKWNMYEEIVSYVEANTEEIKSRYPVLYLAYLMTKMAVNEDDALIEEYGTFLDSLENRLTTEQLTDYYSDLYNYLSIRIGAGKHEYRRVQFELVKSLDAKELLYDARNGKIHTYTFKQISDTAFNLKEFEFAENFIKKYADKIDDLHKKNIVNLEYAKLCYFSNNKEKARAALAKVTYGDYIYYLDAKMLLLSIEYDNENFIAAELVIDSINKYLKKHSQIPADAVENTMSFIYYIRALLNIKEHPQPDNFMAEKLSNVLEKETRPVYARQWLKEKIQQLITLFK